MLFVKLAQVLFVKATDVIGMLRRGWGRRRFLGAETESFEAGS